MCELGCKFCISASVKGIMKYYVMSLNIPVNEFMTSA